jgi:hypothetical protein
MYSAMARLQGSQKYRRISHPLQDLKRQIDESEQQIKKYKQLEDLQRQIDENEQQFKK